MTSARLGNKYNSHPLNKDTYAIGHIKAIIPDGQKKLNSKKKIKLNNNGDKASPPPDKVKILDNLYKMGHHS